MVRFFVVMMLLLAPFAFAQEENSEGGAVSAPPLVSGEAPPLPMPAVEVKRKSPAEPRWNRVTGSLTGVLSGLRDYYAGVELFGGVVFGTPQLKVSVAGLSEKQREQANIARDVSGWMVVPGLQLMWARLSGPICAGSEFCGQRWVGGAGVRAGYADGVARYDGVVRVRRFYFGELSAQVAYVVVPPAPLTGGSRWAEGVFRFRGGVQLNAASSQRAQIEGNGFILHLSGLVEYLEFGPFGGGLQIGASFGLAF